MMNRRQFFKQSFRFAAASGLYLATPKIARPIIFGYSIRPTGQFTLGNTDIEATGGSMSAKVNQYTAGQSFTATKIYFYTGSTSAYKFFLVVHEDSSDTPGDLLGCTSELSGPGSAQWVSGTLSPSVSITSSYKYWVGFVQTNNSTGQPQYFYTTESPPPTYNRALASACPDPYSGTSAEGRKISCYCSNV